MGPFSYVAKLARFAFSRNPLLYFSVLLSLASAAIELLAMISLMPLFTLVSGEAPDPSDPIVRGMGWLGIQVSAGALLWVFLLLFAARVSTQLLSQSLSMFLGRRVMAQLGSAAFARITEALSISEINDKSIGFYIGLAGEEAFRASVVVISLTQFAATFALSLLYFSAIVNYSPLTAGVLALFLAVASLALAAVIRASHRLGALQVVESRKAASVFLDAMNNLKAVRAFSAEAYVSGLYRKLLFDYTKLWFWIDEVSLLSKLIPVLLLLAAAAGWLALSGSVLDGTQLPFVVTMIILLMRFFPTLGQGVALVMKMASDARSGKDITDMLRQEAAEAGARGAAPDAVDRIEFSDVCFSYDRKSDRPLLDGANLVLERGRSYAIVGKSGIGKSTLVELLLKFYAPDSGRILVNGQDTQAMAASALRRKIVLVSQQSAIFNDTIARNILMGLDASLPEVEQACRLAGIHDLIAGMPDGYQTVLQFQGENLSGGQRQRIAIARGLLRSPDVLILDETTNALDKQTQALVVGNLLEHFKDRMLVFVTHDPDIAARVDASIDFEHLRAGRP